jgi:hypothetical protein
MYIIFYIGIAFAIAIMIMEYFEIQQYMDICKDYNNRMKYSPPKINLTNIGEIK